MSKIMYKGRSYANAGVSSDATSIPTADMAAAFDSNAHINSEDMTATEVSNFVDDLDAQGANLADYVVEQGTSGIWTYRKWNSGIAECWGRYSASTAISTAWGSIYYGSVNLPNYPFSFTALPSRHATLDTAGGLAWIVPNSSNTTVSNPGGMFVFSAGSNASVGCNISVYAIGRWK